MNNNGLLLELGLVFNLLVELPFPPIKTWNYLLDSIYEIRLIIFLHLTTLVSFSKSAFPKVQTVSKAEDKSTCTRAIFCLSWKPASISVVTASFFPLNFSICLAWELLWPMILSTILRTKTCHNIWWKFWQSIFLLYRSCGRKIQGTAHQLHKLYPLPGLSVEIAEQTSSKVTGAT